MSPRRPRSIEVPGVAHRTAPIPLGARVGDLIMSSGISGIDAATGKLAEGSAEQARCAFENMRSLVVNGGGCLEDVLRLTVHVRDDSLREHVNTHWLAFFPDPEDRPARHIVVHAPQGQALLQLEVVALVQERTPAGHAGDAR